MVPKVGRGRTISLPGEVARNDPTLAVYWVTSMDRSVHDGWLLILIRLGARVVGAFGALGLLLAGVGLYGVVAYSVTQRRQEFGIRTALGATAAGIVRLALGRGLVLTGIGLALGTLAEAASESTVKTISRTPSTSEETSRMFGPSENSRRRCGPTRACPTNKDQVSRLAVMAVWPMTSSATPVIPRGPPPFSMSWRLAAVFLPRTCSLAL